MRTTADAPYRPDYMIPGSSEPLRYQSYAEEQLEHAKRRAEDEVNECKTTSGV